MVKPRLSKSHQLGITKQPLVWTKRIEPSRHRDKSLSVCKGRLCSSCQVRWPRSLEGHILVYGRPLAVLCNLETPIHEETSWLSVLVKQMAHFRTFKGKSAKQYLLVCPRCAHKPPFIQHLHGWDRPFLGAWYTSALVSTQKPTLSMRKLKLREVK